MLTNPLHQPGWLASLRDHPQRSYQLLGCLLRDTGPALTMEWLDLFVQYGPRTGIPGLYTAYDATTFSQRHRTLIDARLDEIFPPSFSFTRNLMAPFSPTAPPPTRAQEQRRRCRVAVWTAVTVVHQENPTAFIQGRRFDSERRQSPHPYT